MAALDAGRLIGFTFKEQRPEKEGHFYLAFGAVKDDLRASASQNRWFEGIASENK